MSDDALWYEIEGIKKWIRRRRVLSTVKYTIYACLIIGIIVYFFLLYNAAQSIHVVMYRSPNFERMGLMAYRVTVYPNIMNPTNTAFEIKNLYVKVFINDYYVSELYKPYIKVNPGQNLETFTFSLNIRDLPEIVRELVAQDGIIRIKFSGIATIPLKAFGIIPWHELTIPLDILPEQKFQVSSEDISMLSRLEAADLTQYLLELGSIESDIESLKSKISVLDIDLLRKDINTLKDRLESILTSLKKIEERIDVLERRSGLVSGQTINLEMKLTYDGRELGDLARDVVITIQDSGDPITVYGKDTIRIEKLQKQVYRVTVTWRGVEVASRSIDLSSITSEEAYIEIPLSMTDVVFEIRDLVGRLIVYSEISITPEIFGGFSNIGGTVIIRGMVANQVYEISVMSQSLLYGKSAGEIYSGYPKEFHGKQLVLPIGDATIRVLDRYGSPVAGAIVKIGGVEMVTDYDGKAAFNQIPLEYYGRGITYDVQIIYQGITFLGSITLDREHVFEELILDYP